jgi:hypothetical protein
VETTTMRAVYLTLICGFSLAACGCGGVSEVGGKVVFDGQPYTLKEGEGIMVRLTSEDGKTSASGQVEKDGTFKLRGSDGGSIPAGRYKVAYTHYPPATTGKGQGAATNKETKDVWDVSSSNKNFTLDIGKK